MTWLHYRDPIISCNHGSEICHQNAYRWDRSTDLGVDPKTCGGISTPIRAAAARKQKPGGFPLTVERLRESKSTYYRAVDRWGSESARENYKKAPQSPWPRSLHLGEEKVSSSSSPHSLRSTPFSFCYKRREPEAAIGPDICQSKADPAPEMGSYLR